MPPKAIKPIKEKVQEKVQENGCLILQQKGTFRQSTLLENSCEAVGKIFRRAQNPEQIGKWEKSDIHILMYGYTKGKDSTENKHELPPPYNDTKYYSDIAIVCVDIEGKMKNMNHDIWSRFVASIMGEDSDLDKSDVESEFDSDVEEEGKEESDVESLSDVSETVHGSEAFEEEEEEIVVKKKPRAIKKANKRLPTFYSSDQLVAEPIDKEYTQPVNKARLQCLKVIETKLTFMKKEDKQRLEQGIFNATIQTCKNRHIWICYENPEFIAMYQIICRKTVTNLDPTSYIHNTGLYERYKSATYSAGDIGSLGAYEMYPEKWRSLIDIQLKRDKHLLEGGADLEYATDMFKCSRCGKRKCTYYEMQTRSADEAMTVFIKCVICKKEWKQ